VSPTAEVPTRAEIEQLITILARAFGLDVGASLRQCEKESRFNPLAANEVSGAYGLFQLEPATARQMGVSRVNPAENVFGGLKYVRWCGEMFGGNMRQAYAAYDWGAGHLNKLIEEHGDQWEANLPPETAAYVQFILPAQAA
jgi:soluble lytic murein transglycosylase-like protein